MANAKDHVSKVDVMKEDFGWDIPVESVPIPSDGIIYDSGSRLYKKQRVKIKAMTAREEDILSSSALLKEGTVLDHLVNSCLMEDFDSTEMLIGDRNAVLIAVRITGYGPEYKIISTCEKCSHKNAVDVDLSALEIKRLKIKPVEEGKNLFAFKLPVTKKEILFSFPTVKQDRENTIKNKNLSKFVKSNIENNVTDRLEMAIKQIGGVTDRNKIKHFVMNMPAYDSRSLRKFMTENEPGMEMTWEYDCESCGAHNNTNVPITANFFWPGT